MAEVAAGLGLAASISQLITLAYKVATRIDEFQSAIENAPNIFREIVLQLPLMINLCQTILEQPGNEKAVGLNDCVKGCIEQLAFIDGLVLKILPSDGDSRIARTWKALGSIRLENKVVEAQRQLETYKTTLSMYFSQKAALSKDTSHSKPTSEQTYFFIPTSASSRFIGRKEVLQQVGDALLAREPHVHRPSTVVLIGLGGQGKTSIALEYCRQVKIQSYFKSIFWIDATSLVTLEQSFKNIAADMTEHQRVFPNNDACIQFFKQTIEKRGQPWLVVFDNFDHVDQITNIMAYTPQDASGSVLITSRNGECESLGKPIYVSGMEEEESVRLLLEQSKLPLTPDNEKLARPVVEMLGYLPLAIDQSAAYIRSRKINLSSFVMHYKKRKSNILKHTPALWDYQHIHGEGTSPAPMSVYTSWDLSFEQVGEKEPEGKQMHLRHFLTLLAFFNNIDIQMEMFEAYFSTCDGAVEWVNIFSEDGSWSTFQCQDVISSLSQLSLVQYREIRDFVYRVSLHPLVRDWMQLRISDQQRRMYTEESTLILQSHIEAGRRETIHWLLQTTTETLCHIDACCVNQTHYLQSKPLVRSDALRRATIGFATFYTSNGRYSDAERILTQIMRDDAVEFGQDSKEHAQSQLYLTDVYLCLSRYDEVSLHLSEAHKYLIACDIPTKVHYISNLARKEFKLGMYEESAELYREALSMQRAVLSDKDPQVLSTYASLAQVYRNQGKNDEAFDIYTKTLSTYTTVYGHEHPDLLETMVKLANCYRNQGLPGKAEELYEQALIGNEKYLGPSHPTTLLTVVFNGVNYRNMLQLEKAEEQLTKAFRKLNEIYGPYHDTTLKACINLAVNYAYQGFFSEGSKRDQLLAQAEVHYRLALEGRVKSLSYNSPYTMRTLERLIDLLWTQERFDEAEDLAINALGRRRESSTKEQIICEQSPALDVRRSTTANTDRVADRYIEVEYVFRMACEREEQQLAFDHPDRIEALKSLALVCLKRECIKEAHEILVRVVEGSRRRYGRINKITRESEELLDRVVSLTRRTDNNPPLPLPTQDLDKITAKHLAGLQID